MAPKSGRVYAKAYGDSKIRPLMAATYAMGINRIFYFHNGSIGDFLMILHLMENLHASDGELQLIVAVPRNAELCRELASSYPYVNVLLVNKYRLGALLPYMRGGNCVVTPPTPGSLPLATKLAAKLLSILPREKLVGFDDGMWFNRFLYDVLLPYDTSKLYYETMHDVVRVLGFDVAITKPTFSFSRSSEVFERFNLTSRHYVVVHPFGSSKGRSILGSDLVGLASIVRDHFDGTIVLSGSMGDIDANQKAISEMEKKYGVVSVGGQVSVLELATLLQDASGYIGVDTGVTHLASLLRTKSLVLAHNGTPNWLPYYNENARIIYQIASDAGGIYEGRQYLESKRAHRVHYLERISPSVIIQAVTSFLK